MKQIIVILLAMIMLNACTNAQEDSIKITDNSENSKMNDIIKLNKPDFENKTTLMEAFQNRKSTRSFADTPINKQDLSNLLWAAAGINRTDGGRTVPLLGNIAIYVAMESGVYLYNEKEHSLKLKLPDDIRAKISPQNQVKRAPVVFIMTIDDSSFSLFMKKAMENEHGMDFYYGNQVAYSTQNIYLYACSNNMNTVVIGGFHREKIDKMLALDSNHHSYLIQLVGYKTE
ncbi:MAG: SagB/ThcOx family dehydrogenase [Marinifilaceae bacterium]|jgi:nitroreductase|nr:SagB/ThcOx family dehydrogenase [Marinifilaceae bacterium]